MKDILAWLDEVQERLKKPECYVAEGAVKADARIAYKRLRVALQWIDRSQHEMRKDALAEIRETR